MGNGESTGGEEDVRDRVSRCGDKRGRAEGNQGNVEQVDVFLVDSPLRRWLSTRTIQRL